jgi:IS5 family transposase
VIRVFGYGNHLGIDRRHGFIRSFAVTDAARHDGRQLGRLLDRHNTASDVWADTAYRSAANVALLARRGLVPQFQRPKPRGKAMPPHMLVATPAGRGFGSRSSTLSPPRSAGLARAPARLGLANLVTNMRRLVWFATCPAPA